MTIDESINKWAINLLIQFNNIDYGTITPSIANIVKTSIDINFTSGGRFGNSNIFGGGVNKWEPSQRANKQGGQTLLDTGQLAASTQVSVKQNNNQIVISVGSNKKYAAIHHFGGEIKIPAHESVAKWKANKNKNTGNINYRFAKKNSNTKNTLERKFMVGNYSIKMPRRPFFVLQNSDLTQISVFIKKHIVSSLLR